MVTFAKIIGGLNGQVVTGQGTETIVTGYEVETTGMGTCTATVTNISFVGLQDGNINPDASVSMIITANGNTARTLTGSTGSNGMGSLAGPYSVSGNCPLNVGVTGN
jgi:hypothetical protein